ncbi:UNVERIFIED_CONTAM: hypothetical protein Sradi_5289100 [Sesamum radiatum]|uniref:Endonuclease/exonuclease/phosphatase domain-containing protein n=1 Tax=Sesamum radiatum TaxID=300843 RepID=A0AAW2LRE7_SESRA
METALFFELHSIQKNSSFLFNGRGCWAAPPIAINVLAWNCQGIGGPWTVRKLREYLRQYKPSMVFLSETKCSRKRFKFLRDKFDMFGIEVELRGKSGGLMLLWSKSIVVQIWSYSVNYIDAEVYRDGESEKWRVTGFYGEPDASKRKTTWRRLIQLSHEERMPWLCVGDFTEVLDRNEKTGAPRPS